MTSFSTVTASDMTNIGVLCDLAIHEGNLNPVLINESQATKRALLRLLFTLRVPHDTLISIIGHCELSDLNLYDLLMDAVFKGNLVAMRALLSVMSDDMCYDTIIPYATAENAKYLLNHPKVNVTHRGYLILALKTDLTLFKIYKTSHKFVTPKARDVAAAIRGNIGDQQMIVEILNDKRLDLSSLDTATIEILCENVTNEMILFDRGIC